MGNAEIIVLPGLIDMHVHLRDFEAAYKEDFDSGTRAAIAGGVTTVCDMPNNIPPNRRPYTMERLVRKQAQAVNRTHADIGMYAAAQPEDKNVGQLKYLKTLSIGLKLYMEPTTGNETEYDPVSFKGIAEEWHRVARPTQPIVLHAEERIIEPALALIAGEIGHPTHVAHVSSRSELEAVMTAKANSWPVTCGVTPHHLFLDQSDQQKLGWYARMKPPLGSDEDREFLWANLDSVDVIESDHAPHADHEKDKANETNQEGRTGPEDIKCYGVPGLEAMLPLLLRAVKESRLSAEQLVNMTSANPARILGLIRAKGTTAKVVMEDYEFPASNTHSKASYPYVGRLVTGKVIQVDLRGVTVYKDGAFASQRRYTGSKTPDYTGYGQVLMPQR